MKRRRGKRGGQEKCTKTSAQDFEAADLRIASGELEDSLPARVLLKTIAHHGAVLRDPNQIQLIAIAKTFAGSVRWIARLETDLDTDYVSPLDPYIKSLIGDPEAREKAELRSYP